MVRDLLRQSRAGFRKRESILSYVSVFVLFLHFLTRVRFDLSSTLQYVAKQFEFLPVKRRIERGMFNLLQNVSEDHLSLNPRFHDLDRVRDVVSRDFPDKPRVSGDHVDDNVNDDAISRG